MGKALKFAMLGGLAGAGVAGYRALKQDETIEVVARRAATIGGEVAAAGMAVGFMMDRRGRRKARTAAAAIAAKRGKFAAAAIAAKPLVGAAVEHAMHAAEVAKPKVEHAAEVARPKVEKAAKATRDKAVEMAEVAKPKVEAAAKVAKANVVELSDKVSDRIDKMERKPVLVSIN